MTDAGSGRRGGLRVALVHHGSDDYPGRLEEALREAGHDPVPVAARPWAPAEALLGKRGFTRPLSHVPLLAAALARGDFDVAHAFSPPDALAARWWRRRTGRPVVFTCQEVLDRGALADARQRLRLLEAAVEDSDAVVASTEAAAAAMRRWLALDAPVLHARDGAGHADLYRRLIERRG